ncbi:MAG: phospholipid carrier-dependent glycosyltransferase [Christensenellaceae bacterium]|nr:phospholipid carrier-dependent glycosyltransferase [Christensenellaceae bacterium]
MNKKWMLGFALILLLIGRAALASENLLENGGLEAVDAYGAPAAWTAAMWHWDEGVSALTVSPDGFAGGRALHIHNASENDARFLQTVDVEPDTCYRITAKVKASGADRDRAGAGLSIDNSFASSEQVYDTQGAWRDLSLTGRTGPDQYELAVLMRLGGYGSLNVGEAWFDEIEMVEIDEAEAVGNVVSFATIAPAKEEPEASQIPRETPWSALFIGIALLFAAAAAALLLRGLYRQAPLEPPAAPIRSFLLIALAALAVRLAIAAVVRGFDVDMNCFIGWSHRMAERGPGGFYAKDAFCDYPPGYLYVLWATGALLRGLALGDGPLAWLIVKLAPILMDAVAAFFIYRTASRSLHERLALALSALMAFNPASILNSAAWGQVDSVLTALLIISMLYAARGRWIVALPVFALAVLTKPQALMLAPLGLVMLVVELNESEQKGRLALQLLSALLLALGIALLVALPFLAKLPANLLPESLSFGTLGYRVTIDLPAALRPIGYLVSLYGGTMAHYAHMTVNACNLYMLMGLNWCGMDAVPAIALFSKLMTLAAVAYPIFLYARAKDRGKLFLAGSVMLTLLFALAPMMHERYLYPALVMLLMAYAFDRDARLLILFVVLSMTQFVNVAMVLKYRYLMNDGRQMLYGAVSTINLLAAGALAWTGWEMCVTGRTMGFTRVYRPERGKERRAQRAAAAVQEALLKPRDARLNLKRRDYAFMSVLTLVYAFMAFTNLGSLKAPETQWRATAAGEEITFDLGEVRAFRLTYFGGICSSSFMVQMSDDAKVWSEKRLADYAEGQMYRWLWYEAGERDENDRFRSLEDERYPIKTARYVKLTAERPGLLLGEVAFLSPEGKVLPIASVYSLGGGEEASDPTALIDEQQTVPPYPSYYNGMYFDEIYHGRTAYEHLKGLRPYETTHPPLGKVLIMLGIRLFGMTPFGWRFVPALFGVLMVPLMYLMAKQLFRKSTLALIGAFLLAADAMHFTQSRFATLDAIAVFFIMMMYLFMFRYAQMSFYHQKLWRTLLPLMLSGLMMGLAIAVKWIGIYGALGLACIFFFTLWARLREYRYAKQNLRTLDMDGRRVAQRAVKQFARATVITLFTCLIFFVAVPLAIYYFTYYWHMQPTGGLSVEKVWAAQQAMFSYHSGPGLEHGFSSRAIEWPLIVKPMWYYSGTAYLAEGMVSSISCMGNPVVWWGGLLALLWVTVKLFAGGRDEWPRPSGRFRLLGRLSGRLAAGGQIDRRCLFIVVGFLSQYLPWAFVTRSTFIYHYFASVPFIILATVAVFESVRKRSMRAYKITAYVYCGAALFVFIAFFPLLSGLPAPREYVKYLRWFDWHNY